jgi:hypothetical protein
MTAVQRRKQVQSLVRTDVVLCIEFVPHAPDRADEIPVLSQFPPQELDLPVDGAVLPEEADAPDRVQGVLPGEDDAPGSAQTR